MLEAGILAAWWHLSVVLVVVGVAVLIVAKVLKDRA
jgi:hypothetical protein